MTNYDDLRRTDLYAVFRDTLSYVETDRLGIFLGMADTETKILAVQDEIAARSEEPARPSF